jgi:hypothetical protein
VNLIGRFIVLPQVADPGTESLLSLRRHRSGRTKGERLPRVHLLPHEHIVKEFRRLAPLVEKTGGSRERDAFRLLHDLLTTARPTSHCPTRDP